MCFEKTSKYLQNDSMFSSEIPSFTNGAKTSAYNFNHTIRASAVIAKGACLRPICGAPREALK